jgi:hypothetical protein
MAQNDEKFERAREHRSWPRPEIDLVDLLAIKQKYKSTYRAAVIGEREQCAHCGNTGAQLICLF